MKRLRILIADDHTVVREGLRAVLAAYDFITIVGEALDGKEAIQQALALRPDVVLLDISMPRVSGLDAARVLKKRIPSTKILILTVHHRQEYVKEVLRIGAHGYLLKDIAPAELVHAIIAVCRGDAFFSPFVSKVVLDGYLGSANSAKYHLSKREREILVFIAEGLTNDNIAERLFLSITTIRTHRRRLMKKLNIHTVAGLTKYAFEHEISRSDQRSSHVS